MTKDQLHEHAVQAQDHVEQLVTGLASVKVPDEVIEPVRQCAQVLKKVVLALGESPETPEAPPVDQAPPAPKETIGSATDSMMADHAAH